MANVARSCYEKPDKIGPIFEAQQKFYQSPRDIELYSGVWDNKLMFAFRGTDSMKDVLTDINVDREPLHLDSVPRQSKGLVHQGFQDSYRTVHDYVQSKLSDDNGEHKEVIFTGHSLGGAMATMGALTTSLIYPDTDVKCITFGSPRVVNSHLAHTFNKKVEDSVRMVNSDDPVPMVPTSVRFKHVDGLLWLEEGKPVQSQNSFWRMFKNTVFTSERIAEDHYMKNYEKCVEKMI